MNVLLRIEINSALSVVSSMDSASADSDLMSVVILVIFSLSLVKVVVSSFFVEEASDPVNTKSKTKPDRHSNINLKHVFVPFAVFVT